jgi:uncharacterized membrane protein
MTEDSKRAFARWLATWGALAAFLAMFAGGLAWGLSINAEWPLVIAFMLGWFLAFTLDYVGTMRSRKGRWL